MNINDLKVFEKILVGRPAILAASGLVYTNTFLASSAFLARAFAMFTRIR